MFPYTFLFIKYFIHTIISLTIATLLFNLSGKISVARHLIRTKVYKQMQKSILFPCECVSCVCPVSVHRSVCVSPWKYCWSWWGLVISTALSSPPLLAGQEVAAGQNRPAVGCSRLHHAGPFTAGSEEMAPWSDLESTAKQMFNEMQNTMVDSQMTLDSTEVQLKQWHGCTTPSTNVPGWYKNHESGIPVKPRD